MTELASQHHMLKDIPERAQTKTWVDAPVVSKPIPCHMPAESSDGVERPLGVQSEVPSQMRALLKRAFGPQKRRPEINLGINLVIDVGSKTLV